MRGASVLGCRRLALALAMAGAGLPDDARAEVRPPHNYRYRSPGYQYCPPSYSPAAPPSTGAPPRVGADGKPLTETPRTETPRTDTQTDDPQRMDGLFDQQQQQQQQQDQASQQASPSTNSVAGASNSASPNMIGDFFGGVGANCVATPVLFGPTVFHPFVDINSNWGRNDFHPIDNPGGGVYTGGPLAQYEGNPNGPGFVASNVPQTTIIPPPGFFVADPDGSFFAVQTGQIVSVAGPIAVTQPDGIGTTDDAQSNVAVYNVFERSSTGMICIPTPGTGVVGRVKMSENVSPIPRDRVFVNYSHFAGVPLLPQGVDIDRFVPGFEKTVFGGIMSAEMRFPFASTLSPDIVAGGATSDNDVVFGNMSIILKTLIYQNCNLAVAGGLQVAVPTADDIRVSTPTGFELVLIENESVHLMPYVGALYTPNDRFFAQGFIQLDCDANGNPVQFVGLDAGRINDQNFLYLDAAFGYWMYRSCCCCDTLTGVAPIFEAHWNTSVQDGDVIRAGALQVGGNQDVDIVNLVFGAVFEFNHSTTLTAAYATPVSDDQDFDGEVRIIFNHRFGPQSRAAQAQF